MTHFADAAHSITTHIIENPTIAEGTKRVRVQAPELAQSAVPGQFFMLRIPGNDPLIGRAFALYDAASDDAGWLDLVYVVKGKLTTSLARLDAGDELAIWGPLGNGFPTTPAEHLVMVAGGIGQTPFLTLAREALGGQRFGNRPSGYAQRVSFCYGVRSAPLAAGLDQFSEAGCNLLLATEDGSTVPRATCLTGRVTDALQQILDSAAPRNTRVVCCGPEPMMEAVAKQTAEQGFACEVSLETPMACGIGICFTCVAKIGTHEDWDYKRTCVEGPVFDACQVQW